jgi:hypothetical protein
VAASYTCQITSRIMADQRICETLQSAPAMLRGSRYRQERAVFNVLAAGLAEDGAKRSHEQLPDPG